MEPPELVGTWRFEREIHDHASGADYEAVGTAEFAPLPDNRIRWSEHGVLEWDEGTTPVERTLYLVPSLESKHPPPSTDDAWTVTFEDGRNFHAWTSGAVSHWCSPDSYSGEMAAPGDETDAWSLTWTATGPHKNYTMTTTYRRALSVTG